MGLPRPPGSPITLPATNWSSSLSAAACSIRALVGRERKSALLRPLRSRTTCENAGLHSGKPPIADKDEVPGSSPGRPTTPHLTSGNAGHSLVRNRGSALLGLSSESSGPLRVQRRFGGVVHRMTPHNWLNFLRCHGDRTRSPPARSLEAVAGTCAPSMDLSALPQPIGLAQRAVRPRSGVPAVGHQQPQAAVLVVGP
jgi:hypothetical protein